MDHPGIIHVRFSRDDGKEGTVAEIYLRETTPLPRPGDVVTLDLRPGESVRFSVTKRHIGYQTVDGVARDITRPANLDIVTIYGWVT